MAEDPERAESSPVADRLLVTKGGAAERLGVSVRTVERLISAGRLLVVHVERAARVRASDLEAYVNDLPEGQSPPSGVDDPESRPAPASSPRGGDRPIGVPVARPQAQQHARPVQPVARGTRRGRLPPLPLAKTRGATWP